MMKEYTLNDFSFDSYRFSKKLKDNGRWSTYSNKYDVNYSSILSRLIQEAGRWCEHYASDLFIDWENLVDHLNNRDYDFVNNPMLFGFREMGVDSATAILHKYNSTIYGDMNSEYRAIWRLDFVQDDDELTMILYRVK